MNTQAAARAATQQKAREWQAAIMEDPSRDPMATSDVVIKASLAKLDRVAREMERKWGIGRLETLVPVDLAAKFERQRDKLNAAIEDGSSAAIKDRAAAMMRGWQALDAKATELGHTPQPPTVLEAVVPTTDELVRIVPDREAASQVAERGVLVFTAAEIAQVLGTLGGTTLQAKREMPGLTIERISKRDPRFSNPLEDRLDDIPG